jgi:hypothetical protein
LMEGEGSRRTGTLPHRPAPRFFPDGIFFGKSITQTTCFGLQMGAPLGSEAKFLAHGGCENRRKLLSILGITIRCSLLENQNQSELFETITEQEAIFHGAT